MKNLTVITLVLALMACGSPKKKTNAFKPTWESLAKHKESPDWFTDAKFGIYFHWGVYSVPAYGGEWYPRHMYNPGHRFYAHHKATYGEPTEFGYHDFVPLFKAEKFNPKKWADLFKKAGARFAGPVAEHHDGFAMWNSKITPWNAMNKGPHRDITGELAKEIRANDMKLITTFHHARNLQRYNGKEAQAKEHNFRNSHYPMYPGFAPPRGTELDYLYGNIPEDKWNEEVWFGKLKEVIDNYQPDIIWFDSWLDQIPENYRQKFCAYYLNEAQKWGKEVVIVRKQDDMPLNVSVDDLEKSRKNKMGDKVWMTDETISRGSWCYTTTMTVKPADDMLHVLIDIVSKNGVLLLNISPKADGTIPENQQQVLLKMGEWLAKYGEAVYDTRPWYTFGEGPTKEPDGHFKNHKAFLKVKYSADDIRYTTKGNTVYAMTLGQAAANKEILLKAFASSASFKAPKVKDLEIMACNKKVEWQQTNNGLKLKMPANLPQEMALVIKITI